MRQLNTLLHHQPNLKIGDFILFQEYDGYSRSDGYVIKKPVYAIFLGYDVWDMAIAMNYVKYPKSFHRTKFQPEVETFAEWADYIDILGSWTGAPSFRELLTAYRKMNTDESILNDDIKMGEY